MNGYTVQTASIVAMIFTLIVAVGLPILLCIFLRKKFRASFASFFLGCGIFVLFALVLEQVLHSIVLSAFGNALMENIWLYALYGGLAAGIFEELGRFFAMKRVMKGKWHKLDKGNVLMYGAGHGGIEAIYLIGITYINNLVAAFMINSGAMDAAIAATGDAAVQEGMRQSLMPLVELSPWIFVMAGFERILAVCLHIALSVIVYQAVRLSEKKYLLAAIGLHAAVDFAAVVINKLAAVWVVEAVTLLFVLGISAYACMLWKKETE